jgi:hypothetical protein
MRSIFFRVVPTVRLVTDGKVVELLMIFNLLVTLELADSIVVAVTLL